MIAFHNDWKKDGCFFNPIINSVDSIFDYDEALIGKRKREMFNTLKE